VERKQRGDRRVRDGVRLARRYLDLRHIDARDPDSRTVVLLGVDVVRLVVLTVHHLSDRHSSESHKQPGTLLCVDLAAAALSPRELNSPTVPEPSSQGFDPTTRRTPITTT
jgi:hypothetical protein